MFSEYYRRVEYQFEDSINYQTSFAEYVDQAGDTLLHPLGAGGRIFTIHVEKSADGSELILDENITHSKAEFKLSLISTVVFLAYLTVPFTAPAGLLLGYIFKKLAGLSASVATKRQFIWSDSEEASHEKIAEKLKQQLTSQLSV